MKTTTNFHILNVNYTGYTRFYDNKNTNFVRSKNLERLFEKIKVALRKTTFKYATISRIWDIRVCSAVGINEEAFVTFRSDVASNSAEGWGLLQNAW